ncbi:hypothetical protein Taro_009337 [Colocasia esculenta]|uniref:Myb/SANT-like DNA-binding domain-containing protein n=1 Tax=Colocasia esculenta TaxID=4460 RepID=A0A843U5G2_COLES|nr:hypothetical protein [Colocasia esculenta]
MDGNGVAGRMIPGMLGLEMPLHQHHHRHQTPPPQTLQQQQQQQQQLLLFASQPPQSQAHHGDTDHTAAIASKHVYPFGGGKVKPAPSSEDEPSSAFGEECSGSMDLGMAQQQPQRGVAASVSATPSPWQRMKWTDTMVKLLIMVVYCVGDDGAPEGGGGHHNNKAAKKGGSSTAAGAAPCAGLQQQQQQKKGKWKSVSRAMMEKGYYVSPQQCEDKFNDLNKRYKRVNDILGKGTACRVVENQALLETMDHLSPKSKEEVRKLLNSKHLFFREMCAYHRSCAAAAAANAGGAGGGDPAALQTHHLQSCEALTAASDVSTQQQQQRCYHPSDVGGGAFSARGDEVGAPVKLMTSNDKLTGVGGEGDRGDEDGMAPNEDDDDDDEDDDDEEDDYGDDDDDLNEDEGHAGRAGGGGYHHPHIRRHHEEQEEDSKGFVQAGGLKRQRRSSSSSPLLPSSLSPSLSSQQQQLGVELAALTGTPEQQRQWLKWRAVELEERRVSYGRRALELEKRRFKWLRFSGNKEREMERAKLENERLSLENDRLLLLLRQKEFDLVSHHGTTSPSGPPTTSAA